MDSRFLRVACFGFMALLMLKPLSSFAEDDPRIPVAVQMHIEGSNVPVNMLLEPYGETDWLVFPEDIPTTLITADKLAALDRYDIETCEQCVLLSDLGDFEYNPLRGEGRLSIAAENRKKRRVLGARGEMAEFDASNIQHRSGLVLDLSMIGRFDGNIIDADKFTGAGLAATRLSLGSWGLLNSGLRYNSTTDELDRLDTYHRLYFPKQMVRVDTGEILSSGNDIVAGQSLLGLRVRRDFSTQPGFVERPELNLSTVSALPSSIDLFINNRLTKRQVVDPGPIDINHYSPPRDGKVDIVLTDIAGNQQVLTTEFYRAPGLLKRNLVDFDVSAGVLRDRGTQRLEEEIVYFSGKVGIGLPYFQTIYGFAEVSQNFGADDDFYGLLGAQYIAGTAVGNFTAVGGVVLDESAGEDKIGWRGLVSWNEYWTPFGGAQNIFRRFYVSAGLTAFYEEDFHTLRATGGRASVGGRGHMSLGLSPFSIGGSYFDIDDTEGYQVYGAVDMKWASLSVSVADDDVSRPEYGISLSVPFGRKFPQSYRGRARIEEGGDALYSHNLRGRIEGGSGYSGTLGLAFTHDDRCCDASDDASLFYAHSMASHTFSGNLVYADRGGDIPLFGTAALQTAFVWDFEDSIYVTAPFGPQGGWVIVDTNVGGVPLRQLGVEKMTNEDGKGFIAIPAFGDRYITINPQDLPEGYSTKPDPKKISVLPGQGGYVSLDVRTPGFFIEPRRNGRIMTGATMTINGDACMVYDFGCYVENWRMNNPNVVELNGKVWEIEQDMSENDYGIVVLDVNTGRLELTNGY